MPTETERLQAYRRTMTIIVVVVVLILAYLIIQPFLVAIIAAAVLAYLFYPLYKYLVEHMPQFLPRETLSAIIVCLIIIIIVLVPMGSITGLLTKEIRSGYIFIQRVLSRPDFRIDLPPLVSRYVGDISQYKTQIADFGGQVIGWLQGVIKGIPNFLLSIFITIFSVYFFLKGGKNINGFLQDFFPLPQGRYKEIFSRFEELARGMVMGQIVVGVVHGFLAWAAYSFLGISNPVLWAFLTAIISIIPVLGAGLVWAPIAIYLLVVGYSAGFAWKGVALLAYGLLVMSMLDNVLKPKIIGDRAHIHPLVILFGILGGIQLIGLPGILIGPLVLALLDVVLGIFREVI
ncbi:AI-2E family transporter [Candidatus Margulisiibacteriota bacterium]